MIFSFFRAWTILLLPVAWGTLCLALLVTIGTFGVLWLGLYVGIGWIAEQIMPVITQILDLFGFDSLESDRLASEGLSLWISGALQVMLVWLLFPGVFMAAMSLFLERIVNGLEIRAYPNLQAPLPISVTQSLKDSLRLLGLTLACNCLLAPLYVLLPIGGALLFLCLNGYLISQDYFRLIAARRLIAPEHLRFAKTYWLQGTIVGICMTTFMLLPVINLIAAVIGVAWMTHLFHALQKTPQALEHLTDSLNQ